jgi:hypothetical protein
MIGAIMKLYRNHYGSTSDEGESTGYEWFTSKAKARKVASVHGVPWNGAPNSIAQPFEIRINAKAILDFLNRNAIHPDNG